MKVTVERLAWELYISIIVMPERLRKSQLKGRTLDQIDARNIAFASDTTSPFRAYLVENWLPSPPPPSHRLPSVYMKKVVPADQAILGFAHAIPTCSW